MRLVSSRCLVLFLLSAPFATAEEPAVLVGGLWPNRIVFSDPTTEAFVEGFRVRHGAITSTSYTPDKRLFFVVTDRMETVEVLDMAKREMVDELKLSTKEKRVRIRRVVPDHEGRKLYLSVNVMRPEIDRFIREDDVDIMVYDRERREVVDSFLFPNEMRGSYGPNLHVSPDGESLYVIARDLYELDAADRSIRRKKILSRPLLAGYGPYRDLSMTQTAPGVFYGVYRTADPVQNKKLSGYTKLCLYDMKVESFELGPELRLELFALSPDGKRGYGGVFDMVVVDMYTRKVIVRKENVERGSSNRSLIVSSDGTKLFVGGVGDRIWIYDAETLDLLKIAVAPGDFMMAPIAIPNPGVSKRGD